MKIYYHKSDLDGHCSGAIVRKLYPECEIIGVDYSDKLKPELHKYDETVFVVDFCFTREEMEFLNGQTSLIWIDHHVTAIERMDGVKIEGKQEVGKAGCELAWEYLYPKRSMPLAVKLLGRHDVWDHSDPLTLPFQYGMRLNENTLPDSEIWEPLLWNNTAQMVHAIAKEGNTVIRYENQQNKRYAKSMAFKAELEGYRAIVINKAQANSKIFDCVYDPNKHDLMVLFGVKQGSYRYSLYSTKVEINVAKIALKYGGGGHAGAAGFQTDYNLFE